MLMHKSLKTERTDTPTEIEVDGEQGDRSLGLTTLGTIPDLHRSEMKRSLKS